MRVERSPLARLTLPLVLALLALVWAPVASTALDIDWVGVGDRGNPADTAVMVTDGTSGYGRVSYSYDISRTEITNGQYAEFLNAVAACSDAYDLYNPEMATDVNSDGITFTGPEICSVGDPGNPADVNGFGSVADTYQVHAYETTNAEYAELLNAVAATEDKNNLYNTEMETSADGGILRTGEPEAYVYTVKEGFEHKPVNFVSFWDAARYVNWLANGKGIGRQTVLTTEKGSYNLTDETGVANNTITRKAGAEVFIPSRDEFYKAAYYDTASESYFLYPAGSSEEIACADPGETPNTANCLGGPGGVTDTGAYTGAPSPNGTYDQGGNVDEWTDTIQYWFGWWRASMGGGFDAEATALAASSPGGLDYPTSETSTRGFRVARSEAWQRYQLFEGSTLWGFSCVGGNPAREGLPCSVDAACGVGGVCTGSTETSYAVGQIVRNGENFYQCVTAGESADSGDGPTGTTLYADIEDNTVYWTFVGFEPANYVSLWDALRFANWLENGKPTGVQDTSTTEDGSYTLTAEGMEANTIERNRRSTTFVSSENEWYKAAYYDGVSQSYFTYPTGSKTATACDAPAEEGGPAVPETANCGDAVFVGSAAAGTLVPIMTPTAAYPASTSPFDTLDQGGNLFEWNDTIVESTDRGMRGGFYGASTFSTQSIARASNLPEIESPAVGFRVTRVPEPVSLLLQLAALATLALLGRRSVVG